MRAVRVSPGEYGQIFHSPSHLYNSVAFNELNRHKCDDIHYVTLCDDRGRVRFGIILGQKGGRAVCRGSRSISRLLGRRDADNIAAPCL